MNHHLRALLLYSIIIVLSGLIFIGFKYIIILKSILIIVLLGTLLLFCYAVTDKGDV